MLIKIFRERMQVSDSRIKHKNDCGLFQIRGVVSVSYVLRVRVTSAEHFAETLKWKFIRSESDTLSSRT